MQFVCNDYIFLGNNFLVGLIRQERSYTTRWSWLSHGIADLYIGALAYADDNVTLLTPCKSTRSIVISVCENYAAEYDIMSNGDKISCYFLTPERPSIEILITKHFLLLICNNIHLKIKKNVKFFLCNDLQGGAYMSQ